MVGMAMTFGNADYSTPHGGQPFHYWKKGYGFGHARGPGGHVQDPAIPEKLRFTPKGDRAFASSPFWRRRHEIGLASGFGIGDRPDFARGPKDGSVAPDNYGDVSKALEHTRRNATRSNISMKPRYPSMEERYRDLSWPTSGPGPAKYDTSIGAGKSSWVYPSRLPSWTCQPRGIISGEFREQMEKPGPPDYEVRGKVGANYPIKRGTLYDISFKGRLKHKDVAGEVSPGPARYNLQGLGGTMPMYGRPLDQYGLWEKIHNVKVPKNKPPTSSRPVDRVEEDPEEEEAQEAAFAQSGAMPAAGSGESGPDTRTLLRVETAPL